MRNFNELSGSIRFEIMKQLDELYNPADSRCIALTSMGDTKFLLYKERKYYKGVIPKPKLHLFRLNIGNPNTEFVSVNLIKQKTY